MSPASSTSEHLTPSVRNIFKCDQCTSYFESARGLKSHQGRKHKVILSTTLPPIPQVNGTSEKPVMESDFDETFCLLVLSYKNDFERDRGFSLHMFEDHEPHDVAKDFWQRLDQGKCSIYQQPNVNKIFKVARSNLTRYCNI